MIEHRTAGRNLFQFPDMPPETIRLAARWIIPVEGDPIEQGTVEIESGLIVAVHHSQDPRATNLGNVAIIPGLVNTHTHLEFSGLRRPLEPPQPFTHWVRSLIAYRRERGDPSENIRLGLRELGSAGTTTCGEIASVDSLPDFWEGKAPRCVVFRELLSRFPESRAEQLAIARKHLETWRDAGATDENGPFAGISPHAPYSVHPDLFRDLIDLAVEFRAPVATHIAETLAELEFLRSSTGDWRRLYEELQIWRDGSMPIHLRPLDYLHELARAPRSLVIHGNYLKDDEMAFIAAQPQMSVVYCPRTHAFLGRNNHPWLQLLDKRARVALGTDSRASNPDLNLWSEVCFLREQFPQVDPRRLLQLVTLDGARALGLDDHVGSIIPGKSADFAVIELEGTSASDPHAAIFESNQGVTCAMRTGIWFDGVSPDHAEFLSE